MTTTRSNKQKVWPLFLLAGALVVFGFAYLFAFPVETSVEPTSLPEPFEQPVDETPAEGELSEPIKLAYGPGARTFELDLRQTRESEDGTVHSRIAMRVVDTPTDAAPEDASTWERRYENARVQVGSDAIIGREISAEVERLLENSAHRVVADSSGEIRQYQLISSESAQLRQTLVMVRGALAILRPRFPRERIRSGEEWSWSAPVRVRPRDVEDPSQLQGNIDFRARVIGTEPRGVVLEVQFDNSSEGTIRGDEEDHPVRSEGSGRGRVVWSPQTQQIVESVAKQTQTVTHADRVVEATHTLRLVAE